ncbi:hypothetical protein IQ277_23840 [Nostocales cyanobacterium LEGE 12452]|nr:hypothetical protein [Nostocales cyanobacterium LEGE 12452]
MATFGDLGWGKAKSRGQKAEGRRTEKFPQLKLYLDYSTSASQESLLAIARLGQKSQ